MENEKPVRQNSSHSNTLDKRIKPNGKSQMGKCFQ